ncbi:MAG: aryl-alcohol dehydrogenase [Rhodospirillaceae bacterium]|jgi:aryl-alcohol dehydrogenase-like predicted oxidoreductase|nr:aryl-alcohol dehydrogenase [Rhodospirillaceae bacterium]|tara:strand:+ start:538 stop:1431 length:894 start_codon:yes stop_codon:yes gene_type:complete
MIAKLAIGTVQFGKAYGVSNQHGQTQAEEVRQIIQYADHCGIDCYDTAPTYGNSEEVLGTLLHEIGVRQACRVVTKTPHLKVHTVDEASIEQVRHVFSKSLEKLNSKRVEGLLVHAANDLLIVGGNILYQALRDEKESGRTEKIGVSIYTGEQIDAILDQFDIDLIQLPFNILDQHLLHDGQLDRLKDRGVEIHVRSIFLQGLLLMEREQLPEYFSNHRATIGHFHAVADERNLTPLQLSLSYGIALPQVDKIVVGVNNLQQLQEVVAAAQIQVDVEELHELAVNEPILLNPALWKL